MKKAKKRSARVGSLADISVTNGPIDKRQTRMCREMHLLAYAMSLGERHVTRAVLMAPSVKICGFWTFFTIQFGAQKVIDFRRRDKRSFAEECTGFKNPAGGPAVAGAAGDCPPPAPAVFVSVFVSVSVCV